MTDLSVGATLHGFTIISKESISEIDGTAYRMQHEKSGAQLLYLANDDNNKAFSISFKTPAADSTGVFHILEHSVLCGSQKFPVKEPFVNLIKSSMQTFLNAMTFPDKTMYPVASTNEQDLINLIDVYMDAVLNPMIYDKRAIFEQEGWHYEIDEETGTLVYNGVVYNEMKGALSNPDSVLFNGLSSAIFPDTTYRFESGGDPRNIPDLTYENFLDSHKRHYRLDNSYLSLYGNLDIDHVLGFIVDEYLDHATPTEGKPNTIDLQSPVVSLDNRIPMQTSSDNACMGLAYVVGTAHERERMLAIDILLDAIAGSNESPLKRAVLSAGIAGDFEAYLVDSLLQPLLVMQLKSNKPDSSKAFQDIITKTVTDLCENGIGKEKLEAALSRAEFVLRERDFDTADGVILAMQSMNGWLYDDEAATDYLRFDHIFATLRSKLDSRYFEDLLRDLVLESDHYALAEVIPVDNIDDAESDRLNDIQNALDDAEIANVNTEVERLRQLQEKEDSPEDLATLPLLRLSDIVDPPSEKNLELITDTPIPCLYHDLPTHQIDYLYYYFDFNHLDFADLPYVSILTTLLGKLDTEHYTAEVLNDVIQSRLGGLRFFSEINEFDDDMTRVDFRLVVAASALSQNIEDLCALPSHVLHSTQFTDTSKIKDLLTQRRIAMEQGYISSGHIAAMSRCASYCNDAARIREELGGIDFYLFLKDLLEHFDERCNDLVKRLEYIRHRIFATPQVVASFTGSKTQRDRFWELFDSCEMNIAVVNERDRSLVVPQLEVKNEAFIVPADICYVGKGYDRRLLNASYNGTWQVAGRAVSFDYLWGEVRVKGGAYGAGLRLARTGVTQFYSYRDPQLDDTIRRFEQTGLWLKDFSPSESEMRGYLISTTAGHDSPKKSREIARRQDSAYFSGYPLDYRAQIRSEILKTNPEQVRSLGVPIEEVIQKDYRCVFGNEEILRSSRLDWNTVELLK